MNKWKLRSQFRYRDIVLAITIVDFVDICILKLSYLTVSFVIKFRYKFLLCVHVDPDSNWPASIDPISEQLTLDLTNVSPTWFDRLRGKRASANESLDSDESESAKAAWAIVQQKINRRIIITGTIVRLRLRKKEIITKCHVLSIIIVSSKQFNRIFGKNCSQLSEWNTTGYGKCLSSVISTFRHRNSVRFENNNNRRGPWLLAWHITPKGRFCWWRNMSKESVARRRGIDLTRPNGLIQ